MLIQFFLFFLVFTNMYCDTQDKKTKEEIKNDKPLVEELELLDQVESEVIYLASECPESVIITKQDIVQRGFDGNKYSVPELEDQNIADQYSRVLKATISNDDINRNLKKNGLDDKQIVQLANAWGYLCKEDFFEDLKKIYRANGALSFEIESQLISSEEELRKFYTVNCKEFEEEAKYFIQTSFIPFGDIKDKEKLKQDLKDYIDGKGSKPEFVNWSDTIKITESEITKNNDFLVDLTEGKIYLKEFEDGFNLYKMINKNPRQVIPFETVKEQIGLRLKKDKYPEAVNKVKEKLRCQSIIVRPPEKFSVPKNVEEINKID